ncbi:serine O-acetyltransferase [Oceaniferula marina]|nr:DapH/DapD/GlmU-related protein [Oceaniferula marina]
MTVHGKNKWIRNSRLANTLIFCVNRNIPVISRMLMIVLHCDIFCRLPKSTYLPHPYGIVIHSNSQIGEGVVINHQVTLGGRDLTAESPNIGDRVYIGAGAKILGGISIGEGASIGANAVVTKDVPAGVTVVGANRHLSKESFYV